jgi:hypothetical protein
VIWIYAQLFSPRVLPHLRSCQERAMINVCFQVDVINRRLPLLAQAVSKLQNR